MPSLGLLDTYQSDDGGTCYICLFRKYEYYDLGHGLGDLANPTYNFGSGATYARFTLSKQDNGEPVCTEVFESWDGEGWPQSIRLICGPKKELAEAIIKNEKLSVDIRNITPVSEKEILNIYLNYYFR